jgi:hypothetical protein
MQRATKWQNKRGMSHKLLLIAVTRSPAILQCTLSPITELLSTCNISPKADGPLQTDAPFVARQYIEDDKRMVGLGRRRGGGGTNEMHHK